MRSIDVYAAGFFDGEGCVSIQRAWDRKSHCYRWLMLVQVANQNRFVLEKLRKVYGGGIAVQTSGRRRPLYLWQLTGSKTGTFLAKLRPWLIVKKKQAQIGIEFRSLLSHRNWFRVPKKNLKRRLLLLRRLRALNSSKGQSNKGTI